MNNDVIKVQLSCGVDYYKGDKGDKPIKGVDYFTQEDIADIVEQIETGGVDLDGYATKEYVDNAVSGVVVSETDPTVPAWAKQANKPSYTASEVGALPADTQLFSGNYNDLRNKPAIPTVPANVSAFNNDAGYLTSHQSLSSYATKAYVDSAIENIPASGGITVETDPTVPSWAKQASKPTYTAQEVGALPANTELFSGDYEDLTNKPTIPTVPSNVSAFTNDAGYLTSHQSLSGYATESYVDTAIANIPSSTGSSYTFTNGLTERDGTVSWNLNSRIRAGSGSDSVVIGNNNTASGYYAFAQGSGNQANGIASHAEGNTTRAWGPYSHAEGSNIIASGSHQHAEGKYNVEDSNSIFQNIAGNGSSSTRSTMFARDWNGNEYLSGNLFVGCNDFTTTANGLTTANAGGNKVATESYVATAIANIPSGGSYTAGQGISIDNGEISLDFGNEIENDGFSFAQHYDNEDYYEYTSNIYPYEINITSYGEADPETGDQETKSISITGEGITFDDTGDSHTLGVSNGELVFDDSPIGSGGGSSYTAGNGIDIDSNGVISRTDIGLTGMPLFASGFVSNFSFGDTPSASTLSQLVENLKKYGISKYSGDNFTTTALNEAMGGTRYITQFLSGDIVPNLSWSVNVYNSTSNVGSWSWRDTPCFVIGENNKIYGTTSFSKLRMLIGWNLGELIYLNVSQLSNLTTSTDIRRLPNLMSDINNVIGDINTRIPSAPTTDGDYVLKVSVSSGTPTYSWVAE